MESIKVINILTRGILSTQAFSQAYLNSDSPVLQELLHHPGGEEGQQHNYTEHTQQVCGTQFKLLTAYRETLRMAQKKTLWSPGVFLRLHLLGISGSKEKWVPVIAAFNLLVIKLGRSTTKLSALNAKSEMKELVLLLNRRN